MILDANGNKLESRDIRIIQRLSKSLDEVLSPEDTLIFRCPKCTTFYLPKESGFWLKKDENGKIIQKEMACCNVPLCDYKGMPIILTRHDYEMSKKAESMGMLWNEVDKRIESYEYPKEELIKVVN